MLECTHLVVLCIFEQSIRLHEAQEDYSDCPTGASGFTRLAGISVTSPKEENVRLCANIPVIVQTSCLLRLLSNQNSLVLHLYASIG